MSESPRHRNDSEPSKPQFPVDGEPAVSTEENQENQASKQTSKQASNEAREMAKQTERPSRENLGKKTEPELAQVLPLQMFQLSQARKTAPISEVADRAAGVLLAQACGDALGVPYEFKSPGPTGAPKMRGGGMGPYSPAEWSDDTQMSLCIAEVAVTGVDLTSRQALDAIATRYLAWSHAAATDVDRQTHVVLVDAAADASRLGPAEKLRRAARDHHRRTARSASNGALVRAGIVGLCRLQDRAQTAAASRAVAQLTHYDPLAGDACVLWSEAIRRAVLSPKLGLANWFARIDFAAGLDLLPVERREDWAEWIREGQQMYFNPPHDNTFTVTAFQAAVGAITATAMDYQDDNPHSPVRIALENAVRIGGDTDTVAAICGSLMGAACGARAVPKGWVTTIHGWPGLKADGLQDLAVGTALAGFVGPAGMQMAIESGLNLQNLMDEAKRVDEQIG